ncbi:MAG TPA: zinc-binding dehydrogenase [Anaerolineales bacterium]|nr:zinc-binding dehydrogenase [Anaerolineales bacterium]HNS60456.1 zinc-binding dehydrogenase [Anaerolineales bacterium]
MMKAVRMVETGKPLELQESPIPGISERDILIRVCAAGICHSDAHYREGRSTMGQMPITLGHEVAGVVEKTGAQVTNVRVGDRVCLHYNITCGDCYYCSTGNEQFCDKVRMLGHHVDGGYAEFIAVPARNAIQLPDEIPFEAGATLMCASATALHALTKSRIKAGETVAVFGVGGLGLSAIQLAKAVGAVEVYAVDIQQDKLELASEYDAIPIDASRADAVEEIRKWTKGRGVNVSVEMIGLRKTMEQAIDCLGNLGRAVMVGLNQQPISINTYAQVLGKEAEIIGSNDHLLSELPLLVEWTRRGILDTSRVVSQIIPLDAQRINQRLDDLEKFTSDVRVVITP